MGNNEFEEAWLDEGFNSYHDEKAAQLALGPRGWGRRYFGPASLARGAARGLARGRAGSLASAGATGTSRPCGGPAAAT